MTHNSKPFTQYEVDAWDQEGRTDMGGPENYLRLKATIRELELARDDLQPFVESACYYRNLAIRLGAKADDMRGEGDRKLLTHCWDNEAIESTDSQRAEINDVWNELEAARNEIDRLKASIAHTASMTHEAHQALIGRIMTISSEKERTRVEALIKGFEIAENNNRIYQHDEAWDGARDELEEEIKSKK
jgi:hypothetical protein